ncbi:hypothetical protein VTP01DRAFT_6940 [Rhizomucor pusillus]|uniref:uncharacterized protein n=1 Tax=Rhizomucor pusillus TaxID=4840 RepID=UPI003743EF81
MLFKILSLAAIAGVSLAAPASSSPSPTSSSVTYPSSFSSSSADPSRSSPGNSAFSGGGGGVTVTVKNSYGSGLKVYKLTNGAGRFRLVRPLLGRQDGSDCGQPLCLSLPWCSKELQTDRGACKNAYYAFNNDEYCCRGEYNSPEKCKTSEYGDKVKSGCKDASAMLTITRQALLAARLTSTLLLSVPTAAVAVVATTKSHYQLSAGLAA